MSARREREGENKMEGEKANEEKEDRGRCLYLSPLAASVFQGDAAYLHTDCTSILDSS